MNSVKPIHKAFVQNINVHLSSKPIQQSSPTISNNPSVKVNSLQPMDYPVQPPSIPYYNPYISPYNSPYNLFNNFYQGYPSYYPIETPYRFYYIPICPSNNGYPSNNGCPSIPINCHYPTNNQCSNVNDHYDWNRDMINNCNFPNQSIPIDYRKKRASLHRRLPFYHYQTESSLSYDALPPINYCPNDIESLYF